MNRKERVLLAVKSLAEVHIEQVRRGDHVGVVGFTTSEIAVKANVTRSNCSGELNDLCRSGLVKKLFGRPTRYLPAEFAEYAAQTLPVALKETTDSNGASSDGTFANCTSSGEQSHILTHSNVSQIHLDAFSKVVGASRSLLESVRLAKMAVGYPPMGMHALILGEAGVGKSTFAQTMHEFAVERGILEPSAPFISFNCAEYANNPEILLSHLFGHVRGAFTGAQQDKPGLIELAHQGVLFLDEIHRLPPQGQEMLFHWLDTGQFRRMGEVDSRRRSRALLVAATTEMDESVLLATFRRRIPVTINLPCLREWSIYDRYELIFHCVREEAETLGRTICLSGAAVEKLLFAHFPGNIGGLRNTLKLACARAYAFEDQSDELTIERHHIQLADAEWITLVPSGSLDTVKDIRVTPSDTSSSTKTSIFEESLYGHLSRLGGRLQELGLEHDEIVIAIERELIRRQVTQPVHPSLAQLKRLVGDVFFGWMKRSWNKVVHRLEADSSEAAFLRVCVHLSGLTRDVPRSSLPIDPAVFQHVRREYPLLCSVAETLLTSFTEESGIYLPDHEIPLVALLLKPSTQIRASTVGIVLMMRGDGIATQLAQTVRQIRTTANLVSIDVPLGAEADWMHEQVTRAVHLANVGQGVLIMTDLPTVRAWTVDTPNTECIFRPDLTTILQAAVAIESGEADLRALVSCSEHRRQAYRLQETPHEKRQVWTCCMTGRGSAMALRRLLENSLPAELRNRIEVIPVEVSQNGTTSVEPESNLIAIVGSVRPQVSGVPFLSVEELLSPQGMERFLTVIGYMQSLDIHWTPAYPSMHVRTDLQDYAKSMLEQDLLVVNPAVAIRAGEQAVAALRKVVQFQLNEAWSARFIIHMAYVVERIVRGNPLIHPDVDTLRMRTQVLWQQVAAALKFYEEWFQIQLTPGEIAYVFDMLTTSDPEEPST